MHACELVGPEHAATAFLEAVEHLEREEASLSLGVGMVRPGTWR
jgi:hypothetical protein